MGLQISSIKMSDVTMDEQIRFVSGVASRMEMSELFERFVSNAENGKTLPCCHRVQLDSKMYVKYVS